ATGWRSRSNTTATAPAPPASFLAGPGGAGAVAVVLEGDRHPVAARRDAHVARPAGGDERAHRVGPPGEREEHHASAVDPQRGVVAAGADVREPRDHARRLLEIADPAVRAE